jgi:hypothetical protein
VGFGFIVPEGLGMIMAWEGKIGECVWWMSGSARWDLPRSKACGKRDAARERTLRRDVILHARDFSKRSSKRAKADVHVQ